MDPMNDVELPCIACGVNVPCELQRVWLIGRSNTWYAFTCHRCGKPNCRPAVRRILHRLTDAGVERLPGEVADRARWTHQPPITYDELLDFYLGIRPIHAVVALMPDPGIHHPA